MRKFVPWVLLASWFFMAKVPFPGVEGVTMTMLIGFFQTERDCDEQFMAFAARLMEVPGAQMSECEQAEKI